MLFAVAVMFVAVVAVSALPVKSPLIFPALLYITAFSFTTVSAAEPSNRFNSAGVDVTAVFFSLSVASDLKLKCYHFDQVK